MNPNEMPPEQLNEAVAMLEGRGEFWMNHSIYGTYSPTTNWAIGGPIIERENIELTISTTSGEWVSRKHQATLMHHTFRCEGETPLIAAMRCYVASKQGAPK